MIIISSGLDLRLGGPPEVILRSFEYLRESSNARLFNFGPTTEKVADLQIPTLFGNRHGFRIRRIPRSLKKEISNEESVIFHGFFLANLYSVMSLRKGKSLWIMPHGTLNHEDLKKRRILKVVFLSIFRFYSKCTNVRFIVASDLEEREVRKIFPSDSIQTVGVGASLSDDTPRFIERPTGKISLTCMSRLVPMKRIELVLRSIPLISKSQPEVRLYVAGSGKRRHVDRLKQEVRALRVEREIIFTGFVSGNQKESILEDTHIFLLTSEHENFAVSVADAIAKGIPVIVSKEIGIADFVSKHKVGLVLGESSPQSIAQAVKTILSEYDHFQSNCRTYGFKLNWDYVINQWMEVLHEQ